MMKTLIIMRHAHATNSGFNDFERKLTPEGVSEAREAGEQLKRAGIVPDLILSSSAVRAAETAGNVATVLNLSDDKLIFDRTIYNCGGEGLLELIHQTSEEVKTLLLTGHNPAVSVLATILTGNRHSMRPAEQIIIRSTAKSWQSFDEFIAYKE